MIGEVSYDILIKDCKVKKKKKIYIMQFENKLIFISGQQTIVICSL